MSEKPKALLKLSRAMITGLRFPLKLTIGITYKCQSRCSYCDIWRRYIDDPEDYMKEAEIGTYVGMLQDLGSDILWLEFTGGEPFLRKDVAEIASFAMNSTSVVAAGITSNGLEPDSVLKSVNSILRRSKKKQLIIGISIDGSPETYEQIRGIDGFRHAIRTFLELKELAKSFKNLRPHIAYTINRINAGHFSTFYHLLSEEHNIGVSEMSFSVEHAFGFYFRDGSATSLGTTDYFRKKVAQDVEFILNARRNSRLGRVNPINLFYDYYLRKVPAYLCDSKQKIAPCRACELSAYVDPYGIVYPCTMWNRPLGDLKKRDFKSIWRSEERAATMLEVKEGNCPNCWTPCEAQPSWIANFRHFVSMKQ